MQDILGPLMRGEVGIDRVDGDWLMALLRGHRPEAEPSLAEVPGDVPGTASFARLHWKALEPALRSSRAPDAELRDWRVAAELVNALDPEGGGVFRRHQSIARSVPLLEEAADRRADPSERAMGYRLAAALAYAYAVEEAQDDGYTLRGGAAARMARYRRPAGAVPAA